MSENLSFIYFYHNFTINHDRLMDKLEIKILFGIIMAILCLLTTIGNIIVIIRFRKGSFVSKFNFFFSCGKLEIEIRNRFGFQSEKYEIAIISFF